MEINHWLMTYSKHEGGSADLPGSPAGTLIWYSTHVVCRSCHTSVLEMGEIFKRINAVYHDPVVIIKNVDVSLAHNHAIWMGHS